MFKYLFRYSKSTTKMQLFVNEASIFVFSGFKSLLHLVKEKEFENYSQFIKSRSGQLFWRTFKRKFKHGQMNIISS